MAGARDGARTRGKSDPIDALAIARAALREPDLPIATHDQPSRELKLLVDHREDLVAERTRMQNQLRWHLHELDPELDPPARGLGGSATSTSSRSGWVNSHRGNHQDNRWGSRWEWWSGSPWSWSATSGR